MMPVKSKLLPLEGRYIEHVEMVHDYGQLYFEGGAILNIYDLSKLSEKDLSALAGKVVRSVHESEKKVVLALDDGMRLEVDLENPSFSGPERLQLIVPGKPTIIWS